MPLRMISYVDGLVVKPLNLTHSEIEYNVSRLAKLEDSLSSYYAGSCEKVDVKETIITEEAIYYKGFRCTNWRFHNRMIRVKGYEAEGISLEFLKDKKMMIISKLPTTKKVKKLIGDRDTFSCFAGSVSSCPNNYQSFRVQDPDCNFDGFRLEYYNTIDGKVVKYLKSAKAFDYYESCPTGDPKPSFKIVLVQRSKDTGKFIIDTNLRRLSVKGVVYTIDVSTVLNITCSDYKNQIRISTGCGCGENDIEYINTELMNPPSTWAYLDTPTYDVCEKTNFTDSDTVLLPEEKIQNFTDVRNVTDEYLKLVMKIMNETGEGTVEDRFLTYSNCKEVGYRFFLDSIKEEICDNDHIIITFIDKNLYLAPAYTAEKGNYICSCNSKLETSFCDCEMFSSFTELDNATACGVTFTGYVISENELGCILYGFYNDNYELEEGIDFNFLISQTFIAGGKLAANHRRTIPSMVTYNLGLNLNSGYSIYGEGNIRQKLITGSWYRMTSKLGKLRVPRFSHRSILNNCDFSKIDNCLIDINCKYIGYDFNSTQDYCKGSYSVFDGISDLKKSISSSWLLRTGINPTRKSGIMRYFQSISYQALAYADSDMSDKVDELYVSSVIIWLIVFFESFNVLIIFIWIFQALFCNVWRTCYGCRIQRKDLYYYTNNKVFDRIGGSVLKSYILTCLQYRMDSGSVRIMTTNRFYNFIIKGWNLLADTLYYIFFFGYLVMVLTEWLIRLVYWPFKKIFGLRSLGNFRVDFQNSKTSIIQQLVYTIFVRAQMNGDSDFNLTEKLEEEKMKMQELLDKEKNLLESDDKKFKLDKSNKEKTDKVKEKIRKLERSKNSLNLHGEIKEDKYLGLRYALITMLTQRLLYIKYNRNKNNRSVAKKLNDNYYKVVTKENMGNIFNQAFKETVQIIIDIKESPDPRKWFPDGQIKEARRHNVDGGNKDYILTLIMSLVLVKPVNAEGVATPVIDLTIIIIMLTILLFISFINMSGTYYYGKKKIVVIPARKVEEGKSDVFKISKPIRKESMSIFSIICIFLLIIPVALCSIERDILARGARRGKPNPFDKDYNYNNFKIPDESLKSVKSFDFDPNIPIISDDYSNYQSTCEIEDSKLVCTATTTVEKETRSIKGLTQTITLSPEGLKKTDSAYVQHTGSFSITKSEVYAKCNYMYHADTEEVKVSGVHWEYGDVFGKQHCPYNCGGKVCGKGKIRSWKDLDELSINNANVEFSDCYDPVGAKIREYYGCATVVRVSDSRHLEVCRTGQVEYRFAVRIKFESLGIDETIEMKGELMKSYCNDDNSLCIVISDLFYPTDLENQYIGGIYDYGKEFKTEEVYFNMPALTDEVVTLPHRHNYRADANIAGFGNSFYTSTRSATFNINSGDVLWRNVYPNDVSATTIRSYASTASSLLGGQAVLQYTKEKSTAKKKVCDTYARDPFSGPCDVESGRFHEFEVYYPVSVLHIENPNKIRFKVRYSIRGKYTVASKTDIADLDGVSCHIKGVYGSANSAIITFEKGPLTIGMFPPIVESNINFFSGGIVFPDSLSASATFLDTGKQAYIQYRSKEGSLKTMYCSENMEQPDDITAPEDELSNFDSNGFFNWTLFGGIMGGIFGIVLFITILLLLIKFFGSTGSAGSARTTIQTAPKTVERVVEVEKKPLVEEVPAIKEL